MRQTVTTVGDLVRLGARRTPDLVAVRRLGERGRTYAELDERTDRLANALLAQGLAPGDRVAAWMEDCVEYVELYLAAAKAGLVMVPINARLRVGEARHPLDDAEVSALVWTAGLHEQVGRLGDGLDGLVRIATDPGGPQALGFEALVAGGARTPPAPPGHDDLYIIGYTSGTTGTPKGAMLTHRGVLAIARLNALSYGLPAYSVAALTGSMSFVATVPAHIVSHLYVGGTCVILGRWDVESLLAAIAAERATFTYVPSPVMAELTELAAADPRPWATLQSVLHSASRADPDKLRALVEVVGERFVEGFGMTENSGGLVTATTRADLRGPCAAQDLFASVGRAVPECVVEVIGEDGAPLPHDGASVGEIAIRSPALMDGYWRRPEATADALRDGWYRTGDLGLLDPAGYLYVADRRTDLIVSGGMNVYPSEVEACIRELAGVVDCAVVGLPHERWGQTVVAAVVRADETGPSAQEVVDHCVEALASFKKPTAVTFLDELPRTTSLKVQRRLVRERLLARSSLPNV